MATKTEEILSNTGATVTDPATPAMPETPATPSAEVPPVVTPPVPSEEPLEDGTTDDDLALFIDDDEDDLLDADEPTPSSEEPGAPAPPADTPAATPPAETPPGEPPAEPPAAPVPPAGVQPPQEPAATLPEPSPQPVVTPLTPEEATAQYDNWRNSAIDQMSSHYALSEDEVADLDLTPEGAKALQNMGSRMYVDAVITAVHRVTEALPMMLNGLLEQRSAGQVHEDNFFKAWPDLAAPEHKATVGNFVASYRHMYPTATPERLINDVGAQVTVALKLQPGQAPAVVPETPVQTPAATPPFTPAAVTRPAPPSTPSTPANPMEVLDQEMFDADDLDLDNR